MARKRAASDACLGAPATSNECKSAKLSSNSVPTTKHPRSPKIPLLVQIISQYEMRKRIASYINADDLFCVALTCRTAHDAILPNESSRRNLTQRSICSGSGIRIRDGCHQKSRWFYESYPPCKEWAICAGAEDAKPDQVEEQPCISCGVNTCNECRIHCVYQSIHQPSECDDELPEWSGFAFLSPPEMRIVQGPRNYGETEWTEPTNIQPHNHHDDGLLDMPLESSTVARQEDIRHLLHFNLGLEPLVTKPEEGASGFTFPTSVTQAFWNISQSRKRLFCGICFDREGGKGRDCKCTLASRFLDRWLCLRCFQREEITMCQYSRGRALDTGGPATCSCGILASEPVFMCLWCRGRAYDRDAAQRMTGLFPA